MVKGKFKKRNTCRLCKSKEVTSFLDLGMMPLAGDYLTKEKLGKEKFYPLVVYFCEKCSLVQILNVVEQKTLFSDYRYLSSSTSTLSNHFKDFAKEMRDKFLPKGSLVLEIGSNDGVLLKPLKDCGLKPIGVDPAINVNKIARKRGLEVIDAFFDQEQAAKIKAKWGETKAVFANNCLAHIDDLDEIFLGINEVLAPDGILVFEVHYVVDLIKKIQYDTIYHEHLCYYSLTALRLFLQKFGLEIFDVKRITIHSGSIRVYAQRIDGEKKRKQNVEKLIVLEKEMKINSLKTYQDFAFQVRQRKEDLLKTIKKIKKQGKNIIGYGAAGRGNILLNYLKIDSNLVDYLVDSSPERYGRFVPGVGIPIRPIQDFRKDYPDYVLILAWSYQKEIFAKEKVFRDRGGKFILPLPHVKLL